MRREATVRISTAGDQKLNTIGPLASWQYEANNEASWTEEYLEQDVIKLTLKTAFPGRCSSLSFKSWVGKLSQTTIQWQWSQCDLKRSPSSLLTEVRGRSVRLGWDFFIASHLHTKGFSVCSDWCSIYCRLPCAVLHKWTPLWRRKKITKAN